MRRSIDLLYFFYPYRPLTLLDLKFERNLKYKTMKIKEEDLLKLGYKKYSFQPKTEGMITSISTLYQKKFDEDKEVYLNCTHQIISTHGEVRFDGWDFNIQINPRKYGTINIQSVQWFNFGGNDNEENCSIEKFEELCRKLIEFLG